MIKSKARRKQPQPQGPRNPATSRLAERSQAPRKHSPGVQQKQRIDGLDLLRLRRQGLTWKDAEKQSGISRRRAKRIFPRAFFPDKRGHLQVHGYDPYTRKLKIPTSKPGEFRWLRARGSRKASLVGTWNNAVKAAGQGDFSLIDAFPRNKVVDGVRLATSHRQVSRIVAAAAESDKPFEDIYSLVSAG